jgi:transposase InsO family protein
MAMREQLLSLIAQACAAGARQTQACALLGLSARTLQRWRDSGSDQRGAVKRPAHNKLNDTQREAILELVNSPAYRDLPPSQIVPRLADQGRYVASESTFYRLLRQSKQLQHRHAWQPKQHRRPAPVMATAPNQLYSWDITYLPSNIKGVFFYLYMFMDVFSRKIVGWQVYECESSANAAQILKDICQHEGIARHQVVLHSDNGTPMKGLSMLAMMQTLGVVPSFSRPSVSDDNPYSEALFRTVKYAPPYPGYFNDVKSARVYFERFVYWYNEQHCHSGIKFVTPAQRHRGEDEVILKKRKQVFERAKMQHPERWNGRATRNWERIATVHLNPEKGKTQNPVLAEAA